MASLSAQVHLNSTPSVPFPSLTFYAFLSSGTLLYGLLFIPSVLLIAALEVGQFMLAEVGQIILAAKATRSRVMKLFRQAWTEPPMSLGESTGLNKAAARTM